MTKEKKFSALSANEKANLLQDWLTEHKARDLALFQLPEGNPVADIVIVATASSARHARSLADGIAETCKKENFEILRTEGYQEGLWVLSDLNDIIIHIFQDSVREMYRLESLLSDAKPLHSAALPAGENEHCL